MQATQGQAKSPKPSTPTSTDNNGDKPAEAKSFARNSCIRCRVSRTHCNKQLPKCSRCAALGYDCVAPVNPVRRKRGSGGSESKGGVNDDDVKPPAVTTTKITVQRKRKRAVSVDKSQAVAPVKGELPPPDGKPPAPRRVLDDDDGEEEVASTTAAVEYSSSAPSSPSYSATASTTSGSSGMIQPWVPRGVADPLCGEGVSPIRGRETLVHTFARMMENNTVFIGRVLATLRIWDQYVLRLSRDCSCGLRDTVQRLLGRDPYHQGHHSSNNDSVSSKPLPTEPSPLNTAPTIPYDQQLPWINGLAHQEAMYSIVATEDGKIALRCSPQFADRFFSTEDFQKRLSSLHQLCFYLWGSMIVPEDQATYYEHLCQLMFGKDEIAELALAVKCIDRYGQRITCLLRLRVIQNITGTAGAFILALVPLPPSRYLERANSSSEPQPPQATTPHSLPTTHSKGQRQLHARAAPHRSPPPASASPLTTSSSSSEPLSSSRIKSVDSMAYLKEEKANKDHGGAPGTSTSTTTTRRTDSSHQIQEPSTAAPGGNKTSAMEGRPGQPGSQPDCSVQVVDDDGLHVGTSHVEDMYWGRPTTTTSTTSSDHHHHHHGLWVSSPTHWWPRINLPGPCPSPRRVQGV